MAGAFHCCREPMCNQCRGQRPGVVHTALKSCKGEPFDMSRKPSKKRFSYSTEWATGARECVCGLTFLLASSFCHCADSAIGDSVADILKEMGLESVGTDGTTAALALLNDA
jgi:uncharacterized protein (UPF0210 family)